MLWLMCAGCAALSSCVMRTPHRVELPVVAPTVVAPSRTAPVVLAPLAAGLGEAQAKNVRMKAELETGQRYSEMLSERLATAEETGAATAGELRLMRAAAEGLETALATAKVELQEQWDTLLQVMADLSEKTAEVAASEQEKRSLRDQVVVLNGRVELMQGIADAAKDARDDAVAEVALVEGSRLVEVDWKWRFFWWGFGMTVLVGVYVMARMYRVLP